MAIVPLVLTKRFTMVSVDHEERICIEATFPQGIEKRSERSVTVVERVEILSGLISLSERTALGRRIRMMARYGQVMQEEALSFRQ